VREESVAAFIAGLLARHLATQAGIKEAESAFLAGMLYTLGRMLALYYFPEDYEEVEDLVTRGATAEEAARSVLGISLAEMGHAVGEIWGLPALVLGCMREQDDSYRLARDVVRFANALVAVDSKRDPANAALDESTAALRAHLAFDDAKRHALLLAALDKFRAFAPALEVDLSQSACVQRITHWLQVTGEQLGTASLDASPAQA